MGRTPDKEKGIRRLMCGKDEVLEKYGINPFDQRSIKEILEERREKWKAKKLKQNLKLNWMH